MLGLFLGKLIFGGAFYRKEPFVLKWVWLGYLHLRFGGLFSGGLFFWGGGGLVGILRYFPFDFFFSCVLIYKAATPSHGTYSHVIFKSNHKPHSDLRPLSACKREQCLLFQHTHLDRIQQEVRANAVVKFKYLSKAGQSLLISYFY